MNMELIAINPKNQSKVNRAISWAMKYDLANDQRTIAEDNDDDKAFNKLDRQCDKAFEKFYDLMDELPKGQRKAIEKILPLSIQGCHTFFSNQ